MVKSGFHLDRGWGEWKSFWEKGPKIGTEILDWACEMHPIDKYLVRFLANKKRAREGGVEIA